MHDVKVNGAPKPAQIVREQLARYLGPFTAANAVKMFAKQILNIDADQLTIEQVPALLEALGPMLRTLLGKEGAEKVIDQVRREVEKTG